MTFEELQLEYNEDIKWSLNKCEIYLTTLPGKISKYQDFWVKYKKSLDRIEIQIDELWIKKFQYYKHDFDIKLTNTEIKDFINKDPEVLELRKKAKLILTNIEFLEKAMKNIDSIRWDIKNTIDYNKFITGVL